MLHTRDDKSVRATGCTPEDEHSRDEHASHTNLLAPTVEPPQPVFRLSSEATSILVTDKVPRIPPRRLALCGGGMRCIAHIGVFRALERYGFLRCVKEVIGISGGALFALMVCLGYKVAEIEKLALELDFEALAHIEPETLLDFPQSLGCNSGQAMQQLVGSILKQKGLSPTATFADADAASKFVVGFRCYATEVQTARSLEFSVAKTPNLAIVTALRATTALPFLYSPVQDPSAPHTLWTDGGVLHNVPFAFLSDHEKCHTWAVQFLAKTGGKPSEKIQDPLDYLQYIYTAAFEMKNRFLYEKYPDQILQIPIPTKTALHFHLTKDDRQELITHAESITLSFLHTRVHPPPRRRFSAA